MGQLPRVPLPVRLLISYLLVIAVGAVPVFLYLRARTFDRLKDEATLTLLDRAQRLKRVLDPMDPPHRLERVMQFSEVSSERVTYMSGSGTVIFDSEVPAARLDNHQGRPEVQMALGKLPPLPPFLKLQMTGIGHSSRKSSSTGQELLYVAVLMEGSQPDPVTGTVLRLARPMAEIRATTDDALSFARNSQGMALSLSLLMSLLSAVIFSRPLRRIVAAANDMADGDLSISLKLDAQDEVGDVARALDRLALQLRKRLASSRSGEAMMAQLAEALPIPVVVLETDGELVAVNGAGRRWLELGAVELGERVESLTGQKSFAKALARAELDADPEAVELSPLEHKGARRPCVLHLLKRPGMAPLCVVLGTHGGVALDTGLISESAVRSITSQDLLTEVQRRSATLTGGLRARFELPEGLAAVAISEVEERLLWGLILLLMACSIAGEQGVLIPEGEVEPMTLLLEFRDVYVEPSFLKLLRRLWEPIGGEATQTENGLLLRLPRA